MTPNGLILVKQLMRKYRVKERLLLCEQISLGLHYFEVYSVIRTEGLAAIFLEFLSKHLNWQSV